MKLLLLALLLQATPDELHVRVEKEKDGVRVLVGRKTEEARARNTVERHFLGFRDHGIRDEWRYVSHSLAFAEKGKITAETLLKEPGRYRVSLGRDSVVVSVSREDLKGWAGDLRALERIVKDLKELTQIMDETEKPDKSDTKRWRRALDRAKKKLDDVGREFKASRWAVEDVLSRLGLHHWLRDNPTYNNMVEGPNLYGVHRKAAGDFKGPKVSKMVQGLESYVRQEAAVMLLDELRLLVPEEKEEAGEKEGTGEKKPEEGKEKEPREERVILWRNRAEALRDLRQAHGALGEGVLPEVRDLIERTLAAETAGDKGYTFPLPGEIEAVRRALVKKQ